MRLCDARRAFRLDNWEMEDGVLCGRDADPTSCLRDAVQKRILRSSNRCGTRTRTPLTLPAPFQLLSAPFHYFFWSPFILSCTLPFLCSFPSVLFPLRSNTRRRRALRRGPACLGAHLDGRLAWPRSGFAVPVVPCVQSLDGLVWAGQVLVCGSTNVNNSCMQNADAVQCVHWGCPVWLPAELMLYQAACRGRPESMKDVRRLPRVASRQTGGHSVMDAKFSTSHLFSRILGLLGFSFWQTTFRSCSPRLPCLPPFLRRLC